MWVQNSSNCVEFFQREISKFCVRFIIKFYDIKFLIFKTVFLLIES